MCTSLVVNKKKTLVGWNLDLLDMEHRVRCTPEGVYIEVNDATEGWMPLFGANARGDFVGMPTCWPYDRRSDPTEGSRNIIELDIDLLLQKRCLQETRAIAERERVCSVPGLTFMAALSDREGNVLHIVPGQGCLYYEKPPYRILTNFSPFKQDSERHPWMGWDRYQKAEAMLREAADAGRANGFLVRKPGVGQDQDAAICARRGVSIDKSRKSLCWEERSFYDEFRSFLSG